MVVRNFLEVHVDDLAALEVLMVEMHDAEFRGRDVLQEFLLLDLGILTVTLGLVLDDFHVLCLHFCHALGTKNNHQPTSRATGYAGRHGDDATLGRGGP